MGGNAPSSEERRASSLDGLQRLGPTSGLAMQALLWVTLVAGGLVSAIFTWPTDPFSIVGSTGEPIATAFNIGLIASGLLALPAAWLWNWRPLIGALYGLVGVSFALAGAFPIPSPLHELATGIFVGVWLLCWVAAVDDWRSEHRRTAAAEFALGAASVAVWLPYDFSIDWAWIGFAAAEAVAIGVLTVWTVLTVSRRAG